MLPSFDRPPSRPRPDDDTYRSKESSGSFGGGKSAGGDGSSF
jgi:hypothetical protein